MKQTFKFKNGKTLEFETFPTNINNLRKIRIHRDGTDGESLWAYFSDAGAKAYDDDTARTSEYAFPVILANSALNFYPNNSWGLYIPVRMMGPQRPECNLNDVDFSKPIFCRERSIAENEAKGKKKKKTKKKVSA